VVRKRFTAFCGFYTTKKQVEQLELLAEQQERSRSGVIRQLISKEVERTKRVDQKRG